LLPSVVVSVASFVVVSFVHPLLIFECKVPFVGVPCFAAFVSVLLLVQECAWSWYFVG